MTQISNADLMREIKAINKVTDDHERRIKNTENYVTAQTAVADYVAKYGTPAQKEVGGNREEGKFQITPGIIVKLFTLFTLIIGLITVIVQQTK